MDNKINLGESLLDVVQGKLQHPQVLQEMLLSRTDSDDALLAAPPKIKSARKTFRRKARLTDVEVLPKPVTGKIMGVGVEDATPGGMMDDLCEIAPEKDPVPEALDRTFAETERIVSEIKRQARMSFNAALLLIVCGTLLVFGGIFMLYKNKVLAGWVTTAAGTVMDLLSGGIMMLYKSTNERFDQANHDLAVLSKVRAQYALIGLIADEAVRTEELRKLIGSLYEEK